VEIGVVVSEKANFMDLASLFGKNFTSANASFRRIDVEGISLESHGSRKILHIEPTVLRRLAAEAFCDINFLLRTHHLEGWAAALDDPSSSANDRYVCAALLKNAALAAEGILPLCQDTGTATVVGLKGESVFTGVDDAAELTCGIQETYATRNLRFSQFAPTSMFDERNSGDNLPAQIDLYATTGGEYQFLFVAKGGGSSNKTSLFQETKALLNEESFAKFLKEKVKALGVAACPPYHLGLVVGGTSPEFSLKMLKLATAGALDHLPEKAEGDGQPYRDRVWEQRLLEIAAETGLGAQFGGKYLALSARVIRCARHGGSCPVSLGVSCSAHRNAIARIGADGLFLEAFDKNPARFLPKALGILQQSEGTSSPSIDLDRPMQEVCRTLSQYASGTLVLLDGTMIVARDAAHARFYQLLKENLPLPEYLKRHPIYYAGPAETPPGYVIGSFGPTTAQRMDGYLAEFMSHGASLITLAKGNRSAAVTEACRAHGGFYLGTIGGAAAILAKENIVQSEILYYPDLGMESVRRIRVKNLPAFIIVDDKGGNLYG
jgi:fumarate hydratase class I